MDNGSSHTSRATRAWLAAHPRFTVTHTPKHASWLNMIEQWFSALTRRVLTGTRRSHGRSSPAACLRRPRAPPASAAR
ncbi:transposase [Streptomyces sp. NPDC090029]|uniref:transposase n=1 Tax=Streptomyces sp. NPDC090029 TaxID=3365924 RepID=UPI0037F13D4B